MEKAAEKARLKKSLARILIVLFAVSYLVFFDPFAPSRTLNQETKRFAAFGASLLEIPDKYKVVAPGETLVAETKLYQFAFDNKNDIILDYQIQDSDSQTVLKKSETVAIQTQASFLKTFNLPDNLPTGRYILKCLIQSLDHAHLTSASTTFEIAKSGLGYTSSKQALPPSNRIFGIISFFMIITISSLLTVNYRGRQWRPVFEPISAKPPEYKDLVEEIIKHNKFFGRNKAIELANRIKGLEVDEAGRVISIGSRGQEVMIQLIDLFRISMGDSSINIARQAIRKLIGLNPKLHIPIELSS
jgi:hypothetical protein